jgi:CMP-N,N'-diacetyllegionaminic acid synthase
MNNKKKYLSIIPARGQSKRVKNKNILPLNGKPLIAYTINSALKSKYLDRVFVSSDNTAILEMSKRFGAETLKRPRNLAKDTSTTFDVIKHAIKNIKGFEYVVVLQPTSPLRDEKHINKAINFLKKKKADAVISVCKEDHSPLWSNVLPKDKSLKGFLKEEIINKRSQDLKNYYRLNGAIYICKIKKLLEKKSFFLKDNIDAFEMSREKSIDIDTKLDFILAEFLLSRY